MATYKQIQDYVRKHHGYTPETCWIAHVKELVGLLVRTAHNRQESTRRKPCPPEKQEHIKKALEYFGMFGFKIGEIQLLKHLESELPFLASYPITAVNNVLFGEPLGRTWKMEVAEKSGEYGTEPPRKIEIKAWLFSPTSEFRDSVSQLDKKLQGRILGSVIQICQNPMEVRGDTIKPLSGDLKGKWRYRIGGYRLIYQPDEKNRIIFLLAVFPRGDAYAD
jgi:mRNA-degrading endonuclease RelE of RelBE toxin-antitoxin system